MEAQIPLSVDDKNAICQVLPEDPSPHTDGFFSPQFTIKSPLDTVEIQIYKISMYWIFLGYKIG